MAWITPITDRTDGARHTLADQNRIAGNLDWLATETRSHQLYSGPSVTKSAYVYNDYIAVDEWANLLEVLTALQSALNIEATETATDDMTWQNMNAVESLTLAVYERYQMLLRQANANNYSGDGSYTMDGAGAIYAGGLLI